MQRALADYCKFMYTRQAAPCLGVAAITDSAPSHFTPSDTNYMCLTGLQRQKLETKRSLMHTSAKYAATHGKTDQRLCKALTMQLDGRYFADRNSRCPRRRYV